MFLCLVSSWMSYLLYVLRNMLLWNSISLHYLITGSISALPAFYEGHFHIDHESEIKDTFISFRGWNKGVAFVNNFNIGRFWPVQSWEFCSALCLWSLISINNLCVCSLELKLFFFQARGPQCALYVPAPILKPGDNIVVRSFSLLITLMHCLVMILFGFYCTFLSKLWRNSINPPFYAEKGFL